ncbi:MAG: prephenate dehydrogenase/arogenate dehydrogenase family protein [Bryobacter sp.]|nr:prephenate dehydrogenase/arogenate dehydrogenase family protein [Bryobacter sp.]
MLFRKIAIVGTGLMGSSFGLAVKARDLAERVVGVSSPEVAAEALRLGAIDAVESHEQALAEADLVLLAQPIRRMLKTIEMLDMYLAPGTLVTDVGSTKVSICAAATGFLHRAHFVGGHPMAGKEKRGPEAASAHLFTGRTWVLTEDEARLRALISALGAHPIILSAEEHDRLVALSSHLPQILSTALASYLAPSEAHTVAGPGLRDMTRLALSSFELWDDILATNRGNLDEALAGLIARLEALRSDLGQTAMARHFSAARDFAERIPRD